MRSGEFIVMVKYIPDDLDTKKARLLDKQFDFLETIYFCFRDGDIIRNSRGRGRKKTGMKNIEKNR